MSSGILRSLEQTFGKVPKKVEENMKYLIYNSSKDDFLCALCDTKIKKVYNSDYFETHLMSKTHTANAVTTDTMRESLIETFAGKIPQIVLNNILVLDMDEVNYICVICNKSISVSKYISVTEENFSYHLLSGTHEENLETYRETLSQLQDIYGGIPEVIMNNHQFLGLSKSGKNYFCTICEELILVEPSDMKKTKYNFENHFFSLEHIRNGKQAKAFSLIPELGNVFFHLPNYMIRNIEYISINGTNFFCSLCNENIKFNLNDPYETKQNFKLHNMSLVHEQNLFCRRDSNNEVFSRIHQAFETFPDLVLVDLKYLTLFENNLACSICEEFIFEVEDRNGTKENIIYHLESECHVNNLNAEIQRQKEVIKDLENWFGSVPTLIQDNYQHIEFSEGNDFQCVLCNFILPSKKSSSLSPYIASVTEDTFENHFTSNQHLEEFKKLEILSETLQTDLEGLFDSVPQFIISNWDHIGYEDDSDDFHCFLCDVTITVVRGSKIAELTLQNFRTHLLSTVHSTKVKEKANKQLKMTEKIESIFGKTKNFILSNIEHIHRDNDEFQCSICIEQLIMGVCPIITENNFYQHLSGPRHTSKVREIESCNEKALQRLDRSFPRIPEFLLRNLDFLYNSGNGLFCNLCQTKLKIDYNDINYTKQSLRCHMDSDQHQCNKKNV